MISKHWEARVTFLSAARPQDEKLITHTEVFKGKTKEEAIQKMEEFTGSLPKRPRKLYRDNSNGEPIEVGYIWASWIDAYDYANGRKQWEERWVEIVKVASHYGLEMQ